jgi:UDP-glucose 4-epimerase
MMRDIKVVFHLAAQHGGRGYIHTHPAECCTNMAVDELVFEEAWRAGVERVCFASSACVYPNYLQQESGSSYLLKEEDADPFVRDKAFADLEYGWSKLVAEMALKAYHREYGLKASSVRIFTAYGERENETHAIIALIAKALIRMDPFQIWGTGNQDRNFTYVGDIVNGMLLAAEKIEDASPVNAGRADRITLNQASEIVFRLLGWEPQNISHDLSKPVGVASRAADLTRAKAVLSWEPRVSYEEGFRRTIEWYRSHKDLETVRRDLPRLLMER